MLKAVLIARRFNEGRSIEAKQVKCGFFHQSQLKWRGCTQFLPREYQLYNSSNKIMAGLPSSVFVLGV